MTTFYGEQHHSLQDQFGAAGFVTDVFVTCPRYITPGTPGTPDGAS